MHFFCRVITLVSQKLHHFLYEQVLLTFGMLDFNAVVVLKVFVGWQVQWLAIQLLVAFMGATLGWAVSFNTFVETALLAYLSGAAASELFEAVDEQHFALTGQLMRSKSQDDTVTEVNSEAFRRCASRGVLCDDVCNKEYRLFCMLFCNQRCT